MLTFFSAPKAFCNQFNVIQRNAIRSWQLLKPKCEVILMESDPGTAEVAKELGIRHVPEVERNSMGTPLVSAIFAEAQKAATYGTLCYVNADIILTSDFLRGVHDALSEKSRSLLVGQRYDVDIREPLDFTTTWEEELRRVLRENGRLHGHTGIDYFVFPKGFWAKIPPLIIGRGSWDNWLIYQARSQGAPVIDLTPVVRPAHQNHDYAHLAGGKVSAFGGREAAQNLALAGGYSHLYTIADANFQLTNKGVRRRLTPYYFYRRLVTLSTSHRSALVLLKAVRSTLRAIRREEDSYIFD